MTVLPDGYTLRVGLPTDFPAVRAFYDQLIDDMQSLPYHPMWDKKGHPADAYLMQSLAAGELLLAECAGDVVACVVANHAANEGYASVPWTVPADPGKALIVHAFGVDIRHQGRGLGSAIMHHLIETARQRGDQAVRLDLIDFNLPAQRAYLKLGFTKCASVRLYYEEVGWQLFHMFEYAL